MLQRKMILFYFSILFSYMFCFLSARTHPRTLGIEPSIFKVFSSWLATEHLSFAVRTPTLQSV